MGSVKSYGGPIAARFFLELCEDGLLGGMVLYLSMFNRRHHLLFRLDMFYCAAPLSEAFGCLLATGLAEVRFHGYNRWPWVFLVEGVITMCFIILTIFFLAAYAYAGEMLDRGGNGCGCCENEIGC